MPLVAGQKLGPYEVLATLGEGGMGEVYRARDTRLGREVALKILPASVTADPERLARFDREARTLASLNHPHIAQIYGIETFPAGSSERQSAIVMELVPGEDLAQRIARGPVPVDEALDIARQIADALGAAHEQRLVHRDLKPANVRIRDDGVVKVLDFGLAKAVETGSDTDADFANSPTLTSPVMITSAGTIVGTAAYMSPEQARGRSVDRRADAWAFGCVLYEMLSGRRPFDGTDVTDVLAAVVRDAPAFDALPPGVSSGSPSSAPAVSGKGSFQTPGLDARRASRDRRLEPGGHARAAGEAARIGSVADSRCAAGNSRPRLARVRARERPDADLGTACSCRVERRTCHTPRRAAGSVRPADASRARRHL